MKAPPRYCSQKCNGDARRGTGNGPTPNYEFVCESCGTEQSVYRSPSSTPPRFCSVQCTGVGQLGEANPAYTGGRHVGANGYVYLLMPGHPDADPRGYIYEHRWIAEQLAGRALRNGEVVHHRNEIKTDNRPENLQLLTSQSEHLALHARLRNAS